MGYRMYITESKISKWKKQKAEMHRESRRILQYALHILIFCKRDITKCRCTANSIEEVQTL